MFHLKESQANLTNPNMYVTTFSVGGKSTPATKEPHSEPIYTDPSLFERSRSLRSVTTNLGADRSKATP